MKNQFKLIFILVFTHTHNVFYNVALYTQYLSEFCEKQNKGILLGWN